MDRRHEAERIGEALLASGWPKSKDEATKVKAEVETAQAAVAHDARLRLLDKLATEIRFTVRLKSMGEKSQTERIRDLVNKMQEACK